LKVGEEPVGPLFASLLAPFFGSDGDKLHEALFNRVGKELSVKVYFLV